MISEGSSSNFSIWEDKQDQTSAAALEDKEDEQ